MSEASKPHSRGISNALEAMAHEANLMSAGYPDHAHQYAYRAAFAAEKAKVEARVSNLEEQLEAARDDAERELEVAKAHEVEIRGLREQLEAAQKTLAYIEEQAPPTPEEWHRLNEQLEILLRLADEVTRPPFGQIDPRSFYRLREEVAELTARASIPANSQASPESRKPPSGATGREVGGGTESLGPASRPTSSPASEPEGR